MTGCKVTLFHTITTRVGYRVDESLCGQPVVAHGLCAKHVADRIRLGGAA